MAEQARRIEIQGQVQGVGFRPFVWNLARRLNLHGWVANTTSGVSVTIQGDPLRLDECIHLLQAELPAMALIDSLQYQVVDANPGLNDFTIRDSAAGEVRLRVTPDASVCEACLSELFDPNNRRYRYPFINCTNCGPRYSLIRSLPYDRANTTMAGFKLCAACDAEYRNPEDRRFHAQPNACESCGPQLSFLPAQGQPESQPDPVALALQQIREGKVVAVKGIGGFHLICDARNTAAVECLRQRKCRGNKPFALMAANLASLEPYVALNAQRRQRLAAMDAPICLCPKADSALPEALAPGLDWLGVMLPHSPLQYLLFHQAAGEPSGTDWLEQAQALLLVVTSANRSGNPLITDNRQALQALQGIADGFLLHDRDIHTRCDDSVVNLLTEYPALVRRGRGLAPLALPLPPALAETDRSVLALGAYFKNSISLSKGDKLYVSQYIGDLDNPECCRTLTQSIGQLKQLLDIEPDLVVADLHPDFYSTRLAERYARERNLPLLQVPHHQAHIAAVMAEHQLSGPVLGLALDGLGLGTDGGLWGGELLRLEGAECERLDHLQPLLLPGGERAAREPWRVAAAVLFGLSRGEQITQRFAEQPAAAQLNELLQRPFNCPPSSSAGRLFDAAAALLGIKQCHSYEAEAAMLLESSAWRQLHRHGWPDEPLLIRQGVDGLDSTALLARLAECNDADYGALLFHQQLIEALTHWVVNAASQQHLDRVLLGGGCFLNQLLLSRLCMALQAAGLKVFRAEKLPCNDSAISAGQSWLALQQVASGKLKKSRGEGVCA
ncbi:carbamoyltransferase HypF [Neptuniibacter halophilus]|uniref:carbamoyltransferase HypF n=1 Tax=Neptuniibacter halophilus TaxID=651666 RepID=UPI00257293F9|nr:carbamoyltransferase HypF [Neptuniibacter halophilus]